MIQVLDAELEMQAVVDTGRQLVDMLLVNGTRRIQIEIVPRRLKLRRHMHLVKALEHTHLVAVIQNTHDFIVTTHQNFHVLQQLVDLRLAQSDARRFRLQHHGDFRCIIGKPPSIRLIYDAKKPKLIERRNLSGSRADAVGNVIETENAMRLPAHFVFCHAFRHISNSPF